MSIELRNGVVGFGERAKIEAQKVLNLCASISSARLDQKHVVADFLMCIDDAIHAFHGYIKNQSNGSDFKHKRMHISEFG